MRLIRRILALVLLVLSTVGVVCCAAGTIGVWWARPRILERVEGINTRVDEALLRVSAATQSVQEALQNARLDVQRVNKEFADIGPEPEKQRVASSMMRRLVQQRLGPRIQDISGRLTVLSDAAVAAASMLRSLEQFSFGSASRIDPDKLASATEQASRLSAALTKLQATLGQEGQVASEREVVTAGTDVGLVMQRCQATVAGWEATVESVREEVALLQSRIAGWLMLAAIMATVLFVSIGLGQLSLFAHAWKWFWNA